jgi:hypothetical protein
MALRSYAREFTLAMVAYVATLFLSLWLINAAPQDSFRYIEQGGEPNTFQIGERVLLFLNNGGVIGRYDIRADGTVVDRYYPYESTTMPQLLSDIAAITGRHRSGATPTIPASVVPARP